MKWSLPLSNCRLRYFFLLILYYWLLELHIPRHIWFGLARCKLNQKNSWWVEIKLQVHTFLLWTFNYKLAHCVYYNWNEQSKVWACRVECCKLREVAVTLQRWNVGLQFTTLSLWFPLWLAIPQVHKLLSKIVLRGFILIFYYYY